MKAISMVAVLAMALSILQAPTVFADDVPMGVLDLVAEGLLDPEAEQAKRQSLLAELRHRAETGDAWSAYVLAALYRHGREHPAQLLEQDLEQAEHWLIQAAYRGQMWALPKLVDLKTEQGDLMTAMAWAQVYAQFVKNHLKSKRTDYSALLIAQLFARMPGLDRAALEGAVSALLAEHGEQLERAAPLWRLACCEWPDGLEVAKPARRGLMLHREDGDNILVEYAIAVNAKGKVADIWILDALPGFRTGERLKYIVRSVRFNVSADRPLRHAILPLDASKKHGFNLEGGRKFRLQRGRYPGFSAEKPLDESRPHS